MSEEEKWDVVKEGTYEETRVVTRPADWSWGPPLFATNISGKYRVALTYKVERLDEQIREIKDKLNLLEGLSKEDFSIKII